MEELDQKPLVIEDLTLAAKSGLELDLLNQTVGAISEHAPLLASSSNAFCSAYREIRETRERYRQAGIELERDQIPKWKVKATLEGMKNFANGLMAMEAHIGIIWLTAGDSEICQFFTQRMERLKRLAQDILDRDNLDEEIGRKYETAKEYFGELLDFVS